MILVVQVAIPLILYFAVLFFNILLGYKKGSIDQKPHLLSFTAVSNSFKLAIAVTVTVFGIRSGVAFAAVVDPLIEVPVLISLMNVVMWFQKCYFKKESILTD